jgi:integrase
VYHPVRQSPLNRSTMAHYQCGSLKVVQRKEGPTWELRFRVTRPGDGRRVENTEWIGLVRDFPTESKARREVGRRELLVKINADVATGRIKLAALAEHYLKVELGADAVRPKSATTIPIIKHYVRNYIVPRFGKEAADDIKPLAVQQWLQSLHSDSSLEWTTVAKIRGLMLRIYKVGIVHELVTKNPVQHIQTRCTSDYVAILTSPQQTLAILKSLVCMLHFILVLTCAATGLRASELVGLRWGDVFWSEGRIRVSKRWAKGAEGETKTNASRGYVPMHPILLHHLEEWHRRSPYAKDADFIFPSLQRDGRVPICASSFVADYLRPAAIAAGVEILPGQRFGLHNLRHSLSNWLVNKGKTAPKTVQGLLRHARIQTTLDLYTQADRDETRIAQGEFLSALGVERIQ